MAKSASGVTKTTTDDVDVKGRLDTMLDQLADNIRGTVSISLAGGTSDYPLSVTDANPEARVPVIRFTGAMTGTGTRNVLIPANEALRIFIVYNNTTEGGTNTSVTVKISGGSGRVVPRGWVMILWHDNTNVYAAAASVQPGTAVGVSQAEAYASGALSIPNNAATTVALDSEEYDSENIHDNVTNNSRLTCKVEGRYRVVGYGDFAANATGQRYLNIMVNGTPKYYTIINAAGGGLGTSGFVTGPPLVLLVGDFVQMQAFQNSGVALNLTSARLSMDKLP